MDDLVTRLRVAAQNNNVFATRGTDANNRPLGYVERQACEARAAMHHEAADEIERLRNELDAAELRADCLERGGP